MAEFSRRTFLKSAGVGAAAGLVAGSEADAAPEVLGPGPVPLTLKVNGLPSGPIRIAASSALCAWIVRVALRSFFVRSQILTSPDT